MAVSPTRTVEVVVQHERLAALAFGRVDDLRIARGAERVATSAGFPTGEQRRAMSTAARDFDRDRAHRLGVAAVDARLAVEDALAPMLLRALEHALDSLRSTWAARAASVASVWALISPRRTWRCVLLGDAISLGECRLRMRVTALVSSGSPRACQLQRGLPLDGELLDGTEATCICSCPKTPLRA